MILDEEDLVETLEQELKIAKLEKKLSKARKAARSKASSRQSLASDKSNVSEWLGKVMDEGSQMVNTTVTDQAGIVSNAGASSSSTAPMPGGGVEPTAPVESMNGEGMKPEAAASQNAGPHRNHLCIAGGRSGWNDAARGGKT